MRGFVAAAVSVRTAVRCEEKKITRRKLTNVRPLPYSAAVLAGPGAGITVFANEGTFVLQCFGGYHIDECPRLNVT
jgi:hypothetical protein